MSDLGSNDDTKKKNIKLALVFGLVAFVWFLVSMAVIWKQ